MFTLTLYVTSTDKHICLKGCRNWSSLALPLSEGREEGSWTSKGSFPGGASRVQWNAAQMAVVAAVGDGLKFWFDASLVTVLAPVEMVRMKGKWWGAVGRPRREVVMICMATA